MNQVHLADDMQDFLKCIHHFANKHYASRGQLDSAVQYRKEKEKRRKRVLRAEGSRSQDAGSGHVVGERQ